MLYMNWPEGRVISVTFNSDGFHLWTTFHHKSGQVLSHLLGFCVHWGGDFKQPISTGSQFTLYYCTVLNWPSHTTSLEPIEDKKRKEEQGGTGVVNGELFEDPPHTVSSCITLCLIKTRSSLPWRLESNSPRSFDLNILVNNIIWIVWWNWRWQAKRNWSHYLLLLL